jgi:hypothetical protein
MTAYLGFSAFILLWVGQLVYTSGKQNRFNDEIRKDIDDIETQVRELRKWGESQVSERIAFNQGHYVGAEMCSQKHTEIIRRLDIIDGYEINVKLAKIETQLAQVLVAIDEIKKRG